MNPVLKPHVTAAALLAALFFTAQATAMPPRGSHHEGPRPGPPPIEEHIATLDLNADARRAIDAILEREGPATRELRDRVHDAHRELREILHRDDASEVAVLAQAQRVGELKTTLRKQQLRTMLAVRSHLTPEQRRQFGPAFDGSREHSRCGR